MLSGLRERAEKAKQARMAAEMVLYESKVNEFLNYNVEKELERNRIKVEKEIKSAQKGLTIGGVVALGAAALVVGPVAAVPVVAGLFLATTFMTDGDILQDLKFAFSNVDKENKKEIQLQLGRMEHAIKNTINEKTTMDDYFKGAKETIKAIYKAATEKKDINQAVYNQYNKSVDNILAKRNEMRMKFNEMAPASVSMKI